MSKSYIHSYAVARFWVVLDWVKDDCHITRMADNPCYGLIKADARTIFVLGNGPSLRDVSLPALSGFATIGLNAAYRYWREIDWRPRYYACVDLVVGLSHKDAVAELIREKRIERFLLRNNLIEALGETAYDPRVVNFDALRIRKPILALDPPTTGSHAALWAASMGYETIVMLGVDARYEQVVAGAERREGIELEIVKEENNPNYFFKGYQAPGDRYNLPNPRPDLHVDAWRRAGARLAHEGVQVFNGNKASAVRCFPFVDYAQLISDGARSTPAEETLPAPEFPESRPPMSAGRRLRAFAAAYAAKTLALASALAGAVALWAVIAEPGPALGLAVAAVAAGFLTGWLALLYVRFTVLDHLRRQEQDMTALRARIADMERWSSGAGNPPG